jgi:hypothetical protein
VLTVASARSGFSHAKAQRKPVETRQRFAPFRLCVRNLHKHCRDENDRIFAKFFLDWPVKPEV